MAEHFLIKSRIDLERCIKIGDETAVEQYDTLHALLMEKAGPETAKLFAEPLISKGNDRAAATVSWYSDRAGQGVPMSKLDAAGQDELKAALTERLAPLRDLLNDPEAGEFAAAALHVGSASDILSVDGHPVIISWGVLPDAAVGDAAGRSAQYARTLGPFLPLDAPPPLAQSERGQFKPQAAAAIGTAATVAAAAAPVAAASSAKTAAPTAGTSEGASAAGGVGSNPPPQNAPPPRGRVPMLAWLPLVLLLLLFGGVLAWLLVPGNRIFAQDGAQPVVTDEETLRAARDINRALEQRLADLNGALEGAQCRADGTLLMPDGLTIEGLLPPEFQQGAVQAGEIIKADTTPVLPPAPERVVVPDQSGQLTDTASLLQHIDDRTAMVLAGSLKGMQTGTGFFIGPDLLVTNYHVIQGSTPENIYVTSKSMGALKRVKIIKTYGPMRDVGADFALLQVEDVEAPFYTLRQSDQSMRLQSVIAAGYPGDLLSTDAAYDQFRRGNLAAVPELTVTDGTVNAEQKMSVVTNAVVHSAPISKGNSGGPLVDMCGRLVGVNTFVLQGPMRNLNFALATDDLMAFLAGTPAAPEVSSDACTPMVARPSPVPIAANE